MVSANAGQCIALCASFQHLQDTTERANHAVEAAHLELKHHFRVINQVLGISEHPQPFAEPREGTQSISSRLV